MKKTVIEALAPLASLASLDFHHPDHLTSAGVDTDTSGNIVQLTDYYPYGDSRIEETTTAFHNDYTYTGKERDEDTGLLYYEARYYDSQLGRFISLDPWAGDIRDPQSLNKYTYVKNNPLKYNDPKGKQAQSINYSYFWWYENYPVITNNLNSDIKQVNQAVKTISKETAKTAWESSPYIVAGIVSLGTANPGLVLKAYQGVSLLKDAVDTSLALESAWKAYEAGKITREKFEARVRTSMLIFSFDFVPYVSKKTDVRAVQTVLLQAGQAFIKNRLAKKAKEQEEKKKQKQ